MCTLKPTVVSTLRLFSGFELNPYHRPQSLCYNMAKHYVRSSIRVIFVFSVITRWQRTATMILFSTDTARLTTAIHPSVAMAASPQTAVRLVTCHPEPCLTDCRFDTLVPTDIGTQSIKRKETDNSLLVLKILLKHLTMTCDSCGHCVTSGSQQKVRLAIQV